MVAEPVFLFEEFAQFLANLSPRKVLSFKSSERSQQRVNFLLEKNKSAGLSVEEHREMEKYMLLDHLVQLAKTKALLKIAPK